MLFFKATIVFDTDYTFFFLNAHYFEPDCRKCLVNIILKRTIDFLNNRYFELDYTSVM